MAVERIIGVDFGTSTSVIRVKRYENGTYVGEKLETRDVVFNNTPITPTLVLQKNEDPSVCYFGYEAQNPKDKFTSFHSFKMDLESSDPEAKARARDLTAAFYGYLAQEYKSQSDGGYLGEYEDKKRTLISYPVKWSEETKAFMLETAKKAGFPNVTGMDEAQAAIQAVTVMSADHLKKHGLLTAGQTATILLIDMGAGTTDLVLARYTPGEKPKTEILNTWPRGGDLQFGGREIDSLLPNYFRELLLEIAPPKIAEKLLNIPADQYKSWKELTLSPDLAKGESVTYFSALANRLNLLDMELDFCLDREAFETCLSGYLPQFPALVKGCLEDANISGSEVDLVIVTGGHSQWYFVNEMLTGKLTRFGDMGLTKIQKDPARIVPISRPQETVALGLVYSGLPVEFIVPKPDRSGPAEAEKDLVDTITKIINKKADVSTEGSFRLKLDPNSQPLYFNGAAVVFGTVESGSVKIGDAVYVNGGPADGECIQVKNIALGNENVSSARADDEIAIQLTGITMKEAGLATHITAKPGKKPPKPPVPTENPVDALARDLIENHSDTKPWKLAYSMGDSISKLRDFLKVPADEPTLLARDCTVFSTGKNGTVVTPKGIYICETFGQPYYISWHKFASGKLTLVPDQSTIYLEIGAKVRIAAGYFLGKDCVTPAFRIYQDLQAALQKYWDIHPYKPEPPKPPIPPAPGPGPSVPTNSVEELVQRYVDNYPASELQKFSNETSSQKLRPFLGVPKNEKILVAQDCSLFNAGKVGTVITPKGIYVREPFNQPVYIGWKEFVDREYELEHNVYDIFLACGSSPKKIVGYFVTDSITAAAFPFYQGLREYLQHADFENYTGSGINVYTLPAGKSITGAADAVKCYFAAQSMETQFLEENGCLLIQARAIGGNWQQFLGLDKAITVRFTPVGTNQVSVEIGGGKWIDKAIGAGVAIATVVLWPLLLTSGVGAIAQTTTINGAKNVIQTYFNS